MRFVIVVIGVLTGGVVGYFVGAYAGCDWLYVGSNLCGIYGLLLTGPIGMVAGAAIAWRASRPSRP